MMTANFSTLTGLSSAISPGMSWPMQWHSFECEVDQILARLRDAHIRLTLVAITVSQSQRHSVALDALTEAVRMSVPLTDPVGVLAGGSVCALLLGARPPGGLGDIMMVECLMRRVSLFLSMGGAARTMGRGRLVAEAAHRWAGEVTNAQDLIDGLDRVSLQDMPVFDAVS